MADKTGISWTDATWNPVRGCRRTAPTGSKQSGCGDPTGGGCYAERQAARFCGPGQPYEGLITLTANGPRWSGATRLVRQRLMDPFRWKKLRRIFTDSMSDLFYCDEYAIDHVLAVMMICSLHETRGGHIFQTLTKRAARMREYFADPKTQERVARAAGQLMEDGDGWFDMIAHREEGLVHPNLWWGVSVENQAAADERIPELLGTPAAVRFLSCEPLIGPIDISEYFDPCAVPCGEERGPELDWIIAGCESGPGARPCSVEWLRSLRDQCADAGVAFFLKQATELASWCPHCGTRDRAYVTSKTTADWSCDCCSEGGETGKAPVVGFGDGSKRKPGGVIELPYLDGVQHAAFPEIHHD